MKLTVYLGKVYCRSVDRWIAAVFWILVLGSYKDVIAPTRLGPVKQAHGGPIKQAQDDLLAKTQ